MRTTKLFDLSGNVRVITGGNGGIGHSIAISLAEAGGFSSNIWAQRRNKQKDPFRIKNNIND